jgi:heme A synthase
MNAICAGFKDAPKMCKRLLNDENIENDLGLGIIYFNDGYRFHHVMYMAIFFILALFIFLCCYRRQAKRNMKRTMDI